MSTMPATIASAVLAALYAAGSAGAVWFLVRFDGPVLDGLGIEFGIELAAVVYALLAFLWALSAVVCRTRRGWPILSATIWLTIAEIILGSVKDYVSSSPLSLWDAGTMVFGSVLMGGLVAIVLAWRPRVSASPTEPLQPTPQGGAAERQR